MQAMSEKLFKIRQKFTADIARHSFSGKIFSTVRVTSRLQAKFFQTKRNEKTVAPSPVRGVNSNVRGVIGLFLALLFSQSSSAGDIMSSGRVLADCYVQARYLTQVTNSQRDAALFYKSAALFHIYSVAALGQELSKAEIERFATRQKGLQLSDPGSVLELNAYSKMVNCRDVFLDVQPILAKQVKLILKKRD